jgi:hypothetical protein
MYWCTGKIMNMVCNGDGTSQIYPNAPRIASRYLHKCLSACWVRTMPEDRLGSAAIRSGVWPAGTRPWRPTTRLCEPLAWAAAGRRSSGARSSYFAGAQHSRQKRSGMSPEYVWAASRCARGARWQGAACTRLAGHGLADGKVRSALLAGHGLAGSAPSGQRRAAARSDAARAAVPGKAVGSTSGIHNHWETTVRRWLSASRFSSPSSISRGAASDSSRVITHVQVQVAALGQSVSTWLIIDKEHTF